MELERSISPACPTPLGGIRPVAETVPDGDDPDVRWTAVVLAGQRPGTDPVAARFGQRFKAAVPLRGEPMLAHVLHALLATPAIRRVVILSQEDLLVGALAWAADRMGVT